jgi:hypothetical protein
MKEFMLALALCALIGTPAMAQLPPAVSIPYKEISWVEHHKDGSITFHFVDGDQFTVPPPLKQEPVQVPSGGDGRGGW